MELSQECRVLTIIVVMTLLLLDFVSPRKGRCTAFFVFHNAVVLVQQILETQWQVNIHNSSACSE